MRKTIPLREKLTADIFTEMTESYPLIALDGRQYKQNLQYFSVPSDFDFLQFRFDCEDNEISIYEAFTVWSYLMSQMCAEHGYYCNYAKALLFRISTALCLEEQHCRSIIDALIEMGYLYNFGGRLTCIPAVRTFECVQSTRISNRTRRKPSKTDEEAPAIDSRGDTPAPAETPKNAPVVDEKPITLDDIPIDDDERKFFQSQEAVEVHDMTQDDNPIFF